MTTFHLFTIIISTLIFIGLFAYSAYVFYSGKNTMFPPDMAPCPDNWKMDNDGKCKIPAPGQNTNVGYLAQTGVPVYVYKNIGETARYSYLKSYYDAIDDTHYKGEIDPNLSLGYYTKDIPYGYDVDYPEKGAIDFTHPGWASLGDPYCAIKKWAKIQNIQWDGMASYNNGC